MKSKMLGALALFTLIGALFVMQSAAISPPTADAATGTIHALNVGTCLTTDLATFEDEMCKLSQSADDAGTGIAWEVREEVEEVSTLYATYAFDPKTASNEPRVIVQDADLIKISISDSGRDKRTGVLVGSDINIGDTSGTAGDYPATAEGALSRIQDLLAANSGIPIVTDKNKSDIELKEMMTLHADDDAISASGNITLNFSGERAATDPMDITGNIRFFGCTVDSGTSCDIDGNDKGIDANELQDISSTFEIDEDGSSGENADAKIAPWLAINASIPSEKNVLIYAVYYETSSKETLDGGQVFSSCSGLAKLETTDDGDEVVPATDPATPINTEWKCVTKDSQGDVTAASEADTENEPTDVVFTEDEIDDNDALTVLAKADGDQQSVDLWLTETGRFSGQYVGSLRLTDANGDGSVKDDPGTTTDESAPRDDWGHVVRDGDASDAVLGVSSGPVTIEYKDTDGRTRTLRIEIDNQPPAISITNPVNGTSSDDHTPDYNGSIEDTDSGIVSDSFRLVVDNKIDGTDDGATNDDFALDGKVPDARNVVVSADARTPGIVSHASDYYGYGAAAPVVGVAWPDMMYNLGRESCSNQPVCHIKADRHDDGSNTARFSDSIRLNLQDGTKGPAETRDREYQVDFQAFAMDRAGNIGFSDSDSANPRFINDLGTAAAKRNKPNVFGYYSAHIITLDEKDPEVKPDRSATGFYGADANGKMIVDRSGVMVVFDGPIDASSVTTDTFAVDLDEDTAATVTDVDVEKNYVFLKLADQLASDATPMVNLATGGKVEDMAGNETFANEFEQFTLQDGITPQLTVTLSGGSGTGTGSEGAGKLTKDQMTVHIESDEELQGTPRVAVVCSDLSWIIEEDETKVSYDIDDYVGNRSGAFSSIPTETPTTQMPDSKRHPKAAATASYAYTCGDGSDVDNFEDDYAPDAENSLKRTGNNWEYTWQNPSGPARMLENGLLTAVVFARDRSRYFDADSNDLQNWGSASAEFKLDTTLQAPTGDGLQPGDGDMVKESRPFVLIEFDEPTTVTLESVELDDVEIKDEFERPQDNRFVYWPTSIAQGDHEVEVEAVDAAGNPVFFEYSFEVADRGDFLINLLAGWNAISVPADPVDTAIRAVFTDPSVDTVIGWDTQGWRIAVRRDGVWESNQRYAALNEIRARYGYWVKSRNFVRQPVQLRGPVSRTDGGNPGLISIQTVPGWNFVGVIDQDGDQTEDDFSNSLQGSDGQLVTANDYLGQNYVRAYTWDATFSRFDVVRPIDAMKIGAGVWVYYEGGIAP